MMKPTPTPLIRPVISRAYVDALLERSRVVIAEAEAAIKWAEEMERETQRETPAPSGGRVIPLEVWRGKRRGR